LTGLCTDPELLNGTACDDGDACTQTDTCQGGGCVGTNPVVCAASDQCHDAGICDPLTGLCSDPESPDGAACDDDLFCNGADTCQGGTCGVHSGDPCPGLCTEPLGCPPP